MALGAVVRIVVGLMIRVIGIEIVVFVTRPAISRSIRIAARVTLNAIQGYMSAGEREISLVMVKRCRIPGGGIMAGRTILAEIISLMIRVISIAIISFMARPAISRRIRITGRMALYAIQRDMRPAQREIGLAVVKNRGRPGGGTMAAGAILIEIISFMIGIGSTAVVRFVARPAIGRGVRVARGVTLVTIQCQVRSGQGEIRIVMIEDIGVPAGGIVALGAIVRIVVRLVIGVIGITIVIFVARPAIRWRIRIACRMTLDAIKRNMRPGQREICLIVIKSRRIPAGRAVADCAIMIEIVGLMIWVIGIKIVILVARPAVGWGSGIPVIDMAFGTINRGMRAGQGEGRQIMIESGRAPGILIMALRAISRETSGLMIRVINGEIITLMAAKAIAR